MVKKIVIERLRLCTWGSTVKDISRYKEDVYFFFRKYVLKPGKENMKFVMALPAIEGMAQMPVRSM